MKTILLILTFLVSSLLFNPKVYSQSIDREALIFLTQEWTGERFDDGRPKIPEELLERAKNISIEEAWGYLRNKGFNNQFEGNWEILHEDEAFVGRALTASYVPMRPDLMKRMVDEGHKNGRIGPMNSWPIDMLTKGDVYVGDVFGKIVDGTLIGDNLGNAIYAKSKTGVVFYGGSRDLEGLEEIEGFNAMVKGWDPSYLREVMLMGLNTPTRIGNAIVLPGDLVLAKKEGVIFIPAHLAQETIINAEFVALRDKFGHQMLREGVYTPGQIDTAWTGEIKNAFLKWLESKEDELPMMRKELDEYMKERNW
jgi:regulator of RNase E activity RraA